MKHTDTTSITAGQRKPNGTARSRSRWFSRGNCYLAWRLERLLRDGERLTGKRLHHVVFGSLVVVWVKFDVQLIADGKLILQMLYGPDAAKAALHHDGQTGAQGFTFFEAAEIN